MSHPEGEAWNLEGAEEPKQEQNWNVGMIGACTDHSHSCCRFCRGCRIECSEDRACVGSAYIAVDWDPTALHLRYQTSQERVSASRNLWWHLWNIPPAAFWVLWCCFCPFLLHQRQQSWGRVFWINRCLDVRPFMGSNGVEGKLLKNHSSAFAVCCELLLS